VEVVVIVIKHLRSFPPNATGQLNVSGHDGHAFRVDGAQVGVFKHANQICNKNKDKVSTGNTTLIQTISTQRRNVQASDASCNAKTAEPWKRKSVLKSWAISRTNR
jgi:hypothetical protein